VLPSTLFDGESSRLFDGGLMITEMRIAA